MSKIKLELAANHLGQNNSHNSGTHLTHTTNNLLQEQHYQEHHQNQQQAQPATQTTETKMAQASNNQQAGAAAANQQGQPGQQQQQQQQLPPGPKPRGRRKKIRTEPIRPICPQCEKQFSNQSALTKHKLTHSDERKFACHQCSKAFKRHDHLTGHMQTHSNRKPFNCTIQGCDKTYCDARSLRRHKENIHHIITPRDLNGPTSNQHNHSHHHHHHHHPHNHHHHHSHHEQYHQQNSNKSTSDLSTYGSLSDLNNNNISGSTLLDLDHQNGNHNDINLSPTYQANMSSTSTSTDHLAGDSVFMSTTTSNATEQQQQQQQLQLSQLYRRRIQRLHSDQGAYGADRNSDPHDMLSGGRAYLACNTSAAATPHNTGSPHQAPHTGNTHPHNQHHHLSNQYSINTTDHHGHHHQQHASYSADYACTQQFNFDLTSVTMNSTHMSHSIRAGANSTLPLSADSVTDSGLDLNVHYEQLTPGHQQQQQQQQPQQQQPPPPPPSQQQAQMTQTAQPPAQQLQQNLQPSHLLKRRIQRLHSDQGTYGAGFSSSDQHDMLSGGRAYLACNTSAATTPHNTGSPHQAPHTSDTHTHHQHHHINNQYSNNTGDHHGHHHQQHASYSADYACTQQFNFDLTSDMNSNHMGHTNRGAGGGSSTLPLSADSVTDSGLNLHAHYEQLTPSHQQPPSQQQLQQNLQPSHLLKRRIQRLHSDQGTYGDSSNSDQHDMLAGGRTYLACNTTAATTPHNVESPHQPPHTGDTNLHHQHHHLSDQYLDNTGHHQQHASYSAGYACTQQFNFDLASDINMGHGIRGGGGGGSTVPMSAESVTDSGLDLNAHYEQLTPSHQQPPSQQQQRPPAQAQMTQPAQPQAQQLQQNLQPSFI